MPRTVIPTPVYLFDFTKDLARSGSDGWLRSATDPSVILTNVNGVTNTKPGVTGYAASFDAASSQKLTLADAAQFRWGLGKPATLVLTHPALSAALTASRSLWDQGYTSGTDGVRLWVETDGSHRYFHLDVNGTNDVIVSDSVSSSAGNPDTLILRHDGAGNWTLWAYKNQTGGYFYKPSASNTPGTPSTDATAIGLSAGMSGWNGDIDLVAMWDSELTDEQIYAMFPDGLVSVGISADLMGSDYEYAFIPCDSMIPCYPTRDDTEDTEGGGYEWLLDESTTDFSDFFDQNVLIDVEGNDAPGASDHYLSAYFTANGQSGAFDTPRIEGGVAFVSASLLADRIPAGATIYGMRPVLSFVSTSSESDLVVDNGAIGIYNPAAPNTAPSPKLGDAFTGTPSQIATLPTGPLSRIFWRGKTNGTLDWKSATPLQWSDGSNVSRDDLADLAFRFGIYEASGSAAQDGGFTLRTLGIEVAFRSAAASAASGNGASRSLSRVPGLATRLGIPELDFLGAGAERVGP